MYTTEEKICIILGEEGVPAGKAYALFDAYGDGKTFMEKFAVDPYAEKITGDGWRRLRTLFCQKNFERAERVLEESGAVAVTAFSESFPKRLVETEDKPYVLFCKGDVGLLNTDCIAVVGTRKVSSYGRRAAAVFTRRLAEEFTVVSGLAYGVDSIAHETTLASDGKTIAVLGGGLDNVYPASNKQLAERIVNSGGLLVSEYGLKAEPLPYRFPRRNRIVAGLSLGLLVCQAALKSGTFSTVEHALNDGRDVFVIPGEIFDYGFQGSNSLIKSMQGAIVTSPNDIIDYYGREKDVETVKTDLKLTFDEQRIADVLADEGQTSFDSLLIKTGLSAADLNFLLAKMELRSIIAKLPGNLYRLYGGIR